VAQSGRALPSKLKALSSNPNTEQKFLKAEQKGLPVKETWGQGKCGAIKKKPILCIETIGKMPQRHLKNW
jgi:hypothetical protein